MLFLTLLLYGWNGKCLELSKGATYSWEDGGKLKVETADEAGWLWRKREEEKCEHLLKLYQWLF